MERNTIKQKSDCHYPFEQKFIKNDIFFKNTLNIIRYHNVEKYDIFLYKSLRVFEKIWFLNQFTSNDYLEIKKKFKLRSKSEIRNKKINNLLRTIF